MKTAGVSSILSIVCVGFASACSSQVSIGHNDRAVTTDSGQQGGQGEPLGTGGQGGEPLGTGGARVDMGTSDSGFAGMAGSGSAPPPWNMGPSLAYEAEPGTVVELDGGGGACGPVDTTGSLQVSGGWTTTITGNVGNVACGSQPVATAVDIKAVYSQLSPGVTRTFAALGPPNPVDPPTLDCTTVRPNTLFFTAGVPEQLVIFDVPHHFDADQTLLSSIDIDNSAGQAMQGDAEHFFLTNAPASGLGCGPARGLAGLETTWELNPGEETSYCVRQTLNWDHNARYIRIEGPAGTYRSVFSYGDSTGQDGPSYCDESSDREHVLGYGVDGGTVEARLWDGHIAAGQQLVLRVVARNATSDRKTGTVSAALN